MNHGGVQSSCTPGLIQFPLKFPSCPTWETTEDREDDSGYGPNARA